MYTLEEIRAEWKEEIKDSFIALDRYIRLHYIQVYDTEFNIIGYSRHENWIQFVA